MSHHPAFRFIDLCAGVGGFHAALSAYGGECNYAVEVDKAAADVYEKNWGLNPLGDITDDATDETMSIEAHEVLAAGFPCQPFSKSGTQRGMEETRGTIFWNILKIIDKWRPPVIVLENVRNLAGPRHDHELDVIIKSLRQLDYRVADKPAIFSPHLLPPEMGGRPQVRERVFITATFNPTGIAADSVDPVVTPRDRFDGFDAKNDWHLENILDDSHNVPECELSRTEQMWIDAWDDFVIGIKRLTPSGRPPGFPLWADTWTDFDKIFQEFGKVPSSSDLLKRDPGLPSWKASHLSKNYQFYLDYRPFIDAWTQRSGVYTETFPASRRKLEWQAQDAANLWETVMHFRPSGIRAKRATYLPALVAITQTSIIGPRKRRISPRETARLQGLPDTFTFGAQRAATTYRQMGNGVNVGVVWHVFRQHVLRDQDILRTTAEGRSIVRAVEKSETTPDKVLSRHRPSRP